MRKEEEKVTSEVGRHEGELALRSPTTHHRMGLHTWHVDGTWTTHQLCFFSRISGLGSKGQREGGKVRGKKRGREEGREGYK